MPRRPTQADIARTAGVSRSAVAKALNLPPGRCELAPATRAAVLDAARRLGYRISGPPAVLVTTNDAEGWADPFLPAALTAAHEAGLRLHLTPPQALDAALAPDAPRPAAVVAVAFAPPTLAALTTTHGLPLVGLNCPLPQCARPDDAEDLRQAVRHLHELGHRRIVFAYATGAHAHASAELRVQAYRSACAAAGLDGAVELLNHGDDDLRRRLVRRGGPTGLILSPVEGQPAAWLALRQQRPFALVIVGRDQRGGTATSLQADHADIGRRLAAALARCAAGDEPALGDTAVPGQLVVRDTSTPPPA